jgi:DNA repair protein RadC
MAKKTGTVAKRCAVPSGQVFVDVAFQFVARTEPPKRIADPQAIYELARPMVEMLTVEEFWLAGLNSANRLTVLHRISSGTLNASLAHPRECFRVPLLLSCASVVFFHNHPSGNREPSTEDIALTRQLVESGRILGIPVQDHVIIAGSNGGYTSLAERGLL